MTHPRTDSLQAVAPGVATAASDDTLMIGQPPYDCTVTAVGYTPDAAITGAATHNRRLALINRGADGSGSTVVAELTFGSGTNATGGDEKPLTLSVTAADLDVDAGSTLAWFSDANGTGIADPGGLVTVAISRRDA